MSVENRDGWEEQGGYLEEMVPGTPDLKPQKGHYLFDINREIIERIRTLNSSISHQASKIRNSDPENK